MPELLNTAKDKNIPEVIQAKEKAFLEAVPEPSIFDTIKSYFQW